MRQKSYFQAFYNLYKSFNKKCEDIKTSAHILLISYSTTIFRLKSCNISTFL